MRNLWKLSTALLRLGGMKGWLMGRGGRKGMMGRRRKRGSRVEGEVEGC